MNWQEHKRNSYLFNGDEIVARVIYHELFDGLHPNQYGVQIQPSDGGLVCVGYLPGDAAQSVRAAKAMCERAIAENLPYSWWEKECANWFSMAKLLYF